jgi:hypothetical protein
MYKRQKTILINFIIVIVITVVTVVAMINVKDFINRSEALRAMGQLSRIVLDYRNKYGLVPPESNIEKIKDELEGSIRFGKLYYRARWINIDSTSDEILAYVEKKYSSFFLSDGYVLLRLDGRVEWMATKEFESLLAKQQSPMEIEMMEK